jgi:hypothetical protein
MAPKNLSERKVRWNKQWVTIKDVASEVEVDPRILGILVIQNKMDLLEALELLVGSPDAAELFDYKYTYHGVQMTEEDLCALTGTTPEFIEHCKSKGMSTRKMLSLLDKGINSLHTMPATRDTVVPWRGKDVTLGEISKVSGVSFIAVLSYFRRNPWFPDEFSPEYLEKRTIEKRSEYYSQWRQALMKKNRDAHRKKFGDPVINLPQFLKDREKALKLPTVPRKDIA